MKIKLDVSKSRIYVRIHGSDTGSGPDHGIRVQSRPTQRTSNPTLINPCIDTQSMEHMGAHTKLSHLVIFLHGFQAYPANPVVFTILHLFIPAVSESLDEFSVFENRQVVLDHRHENLDRDRYDRPRSTVCQENVAVAGTIIFFRSRRRLRLEETESGECLVEEELDVVYKGEEEHTIREVGFDDLHGERQSLEKTRYKIVCFELQKESSGELRKTEEGCCLVFSMVFSFLFLCLFAM
ncbi:hypothetical protein GQ457_16G025720 [Hibiscus cannabinus]